METDVSLDSALKNSRVPNSMRAAEPTLLSPCHLPLGSAATSPVSRFAANALVAAQTYKALHHSVDTFDGLSETEVYRAMKEILDDSDHNHTGMDDTAIAHYVRVLFDTAGIEQKPYNPNLVCVRVGERS